VKNTVILPVTATHDFLVARRTPDFGGIAVHDALDSVRDVILLPVRIVRLPRV
jgi:hypothetical protein